MAVSPKFSSALAWWRKRRGLSQLQLAIAADCSQRHISFLELGRTKPSRDMVLRLSAALDLPLRQSNELLLGAGFAPVWAQTDFRAAPLAPVREALIYILDQQEPYPAVVVDRHWNLLQANNGAVGLVEFLVGPIAPGEAINLADALVGPDVLRPHLVNWGEVVRYFIRSVEADAAADTTTETANLLDRLLGYKDVRAATKHAAISADGPILPMHFRKGRTELRLFTTIATLGTPHDITLQELRIESFFPMDEATRAHFRGWSGSAPKQRGDKSR
jgi:transcriptional regulator with XRE-family HTH domain